MINIQFFRLLAAKFPELTLSLKQANYDISPELYVKKTFLSAFYMSAGIVFIAFMFLVNYMEKGKLLSLLMILYPVSLLILFFYFFNAVTIKINKLAKEINKEIIFAGRYLIVELESGVPLFDALENLGINYKVVGAYFREIIEKVKVGTAMQDAINEAVELVPSDSLRKIMWQISNSLRTGSDVNKPLFNVLETLVREQQIAVAEYGRKLNPLAMFYMLIAIIIPSLGITMLTIISIFVGLQLNLIWMLVIAGMIGFMQFMFIQIINSSRPAVEF